MGYNERMRRRFVTTLFVVLAAALASGCHSRLTGNRGFITFAYPAAHDINDFNKPIASGATLRIYAQTVGAGDDMTVTRVHSSNPHVFDVVDVSGASFSIIGSSVGAAQIEVTARTRAGKVVTDVLDLLVRKPEIVSLSHSCTEDNFALYRAHSEIALPFAMRSAEGQPVVGYGFWPVRTNPKVSLQVVEGQEEPGVLLFRTGKPRHRVAIRSTVDDAILGLGLVEPAEVDGLRPAFASLGRVVAGESALLEFRPTVSAVTLCDAAMPLEATTSTPEKCSVTTELDPGAGPNEEGLVKVTGRRFGHCQFRVTYPDAGSGEGVSRDFTIPVGAFPGEGEAEPEANPGVEQKPVEVRPVWLAPLLALLAPLMLLPIWLRRRR